MNHVPNDKFVETLFKRLQELDKENKVLKSKLANKQVQTETHGYPYFKVKELIIENQDNEQICSFCNCELNSSQVINMLRLYFCAGNCSFLMEKVVDDIINSFRKKKQK
jgi:hypothetical protein